LASDPPPTSITLDDYASVEWETVHVFGPYTTPDAITESLGFDWISPRSNAMQSSDMNSLPVFVKGGTVVAEELVPRSVADFSPNSLPLSLSREGGTFGVGRIEGRYVLTAIDP